MRGQGAVFNLEVEGNGNYFAEGVLVHNCHHLPNLEAGGQYHEVIGRLLKDNPDLWILGVTATPFRTGHGYIYGDRCREGRTNFFPSLDWAVRLNDLIEEGHLCRIRWKIPVDLERDLARVKVSRGEYDARALGREMSRPVHLASALDAYRRYGEGRGKALVFAVTIEHARTLAGILSAEGPAAAVYDGLCPRERAAVLRDFERGGLRFLVNVGILTEGWDSPAVDLIMMCRPTKSVGLYVQMVGRGTRTREGKDSVLVLDLSDNRKEHGDPSDPKVREGGGRKGEEGGAGGPVKVCPACKELVPAPSRECPVCGHAFPAKAAARPPALEESPEMVEAEGRVPERRDRLEGWCLVPHVSARGNRMARLDLHLEGRAAPVSHWLDFEGSGSARGRERARLWWRLHSRAGLYDPTPPGTVDEAVRRARTELRLPERVTLRTDPNGYRKVSGW
ncbi:MAG: hypothetical protein LBW85_01455 [Deltaproteobacteria bacterium]|nr:hypothetical protein [Deltaproteobacteria bacterium]